MFLPLHLDCLFYAVLGDVPQLCVDGLMLQQEGDTIRAFDRVCEVQSDKATVEITSRFDGIVTKVYHGEGDIVKVRASAVVL